MTSLHRLTVSILAVVLAGLLAAFAPGTAAAAPSAAVGATPGSVPDAAPAGSSTAGADMVSNLTQVNCSNIRDREATLFTAYTAVSLPTWLCTYSR